MEDNWRIELYNLIKSIALNSGVQLFLPYNSQDLNQNNDKHLCVKIGLFELGLSSIAPSFADTDFENILEYSVNFSVVLMEKHSGTTEQKILSIFTIANNFLLNLLKYRGDRFMQFIPIEESQDVDFGGELTYKMGFQTTFLQKVSKNELEKVENEIEVIVENVLF